jgi:sterol desaturase/sphingolipid hydroxylase (fatty acid hydroxylase superfamily)
MTYDWLAALAYVTTLVVLTIIGKKIAFQIPAFAEMRRLNDEADKPKMAKESFRAAVKVNNKSAMVTNLVFMFAVLPFCVSFETQPWWMYPVEILAILLIFDFMYYLTHRFIFHDGPLRKVHSLHHQARKPTFIDALYVHPLETFIGLCLFLVSIPIMGLIVGGPVNTFAAAIATLTFTQLNTINHVYTRLGSDRWLFRTVDYITGVHHAHHIDMSHGNYATLTMFYDKLFGTFEKPVHRETA